MVISVVRFVRHHNLDVIGMFSGANVVFALGLLVQVTGMPVFDPSVNAMALYLNFLVEWALCLLFLWLYCDVEKAKIGKDEKDNKINYLFIAVWFLAVSFAAIITAAENAAMQIV